MYSDKKRIYIFTTLALIMLFLSFFIPVSARVIVVAFVMGVFAPVMICQIKKRSVLSINKKSVFYIMFTIGILYVMIYYLMGLEYGFYRNIYGFHPNRFLLYIIPITICIVSTEVIRRVILAQKLLIPNILIFISCVLVELITYMKYDSISTFNVFMDTMAMSLLPALSFNVLYTYLSVKYGMFPNIVFRLIITLYLYLIPVVPSVPDIMVSFLKLVIPFGILLFIKMLYTKNRKSVSFRKKGFDFVLTSLIVTILVLFVMLVSCKFRYGILVIATESMTGTINKGDAVVYEEYKGQMIFEGDVIVFEVNDKKVIHRVVKVERINNEYRYYTKGDANDDIDAGYITQNQIVGKTCFKVIYIGYPTLWIRDLFN